MLLTVAMLLVTSSLLLGAPSLSPLQTPLATTTSTPSAFATRVTALDQADLTPDEDLVFHGEAYRVEATGANGQALAMGEPFPEGADPLALDLIFSEPLPDSIPSADLLDVHYFDGTAWSALGLTPSDNVFHVAVSRVGDYAIAAPALRVVVAPAEATVRRRETVQFSARVLYPGGEEASGYRVEWHATSVAGTITSDGLFRATGAHGDYPGAVVAALGGIEGFADIHIVPWEIALPLVPHNWEMQRFPNDPYYPVQWNLARIRAPQAWALATGGPAVIAIIDTGADLDHPDLKANLVAGYNFLDPHLPPDDDSLYSHGTHVAGIAGAVGNNMLGVAGTAWTTRIMPLKVLDRYGAGSIAHAAAAVYRAVSSGARIINLSLGAPYDSEYPGAFQLLEDAISYAVAHDVLVVAAAGNVGSAGIKMGDLVYPAGYPGVLGVGSTSLSDQISGFSNRGPWVDVVAPGEYLRSTCVGGGYCVLSGTSMATPHVAGLAALIWSRYPQLTAAQVAAMITASAQDLGVPGYDTTFGYGRIDAGKALIQGPALLAATTVAEQIPPSPTASLGSSVLDQAGSGRYRPGVLLVDADAPTLARLRSSLPEAAIRAMEMDTGVPGLARLHVPEGTEAEMLERLSRLPGVRAVYLDTYVYAMW
ncbi:MAG: peptidase S8 [Anaerolineae bacterium]|nr:peptidase S8 [Anaerolineae bacterium]